MKPFAKLGQLLGLGKAEPEVVTTASSRAANVGRAKSRARMNPAEPGYENRDQRYRMIEAIKPPFPLPHVSRASLRRIANPLPAPTSCPYCEGQVVLDSNDVIYRKRYGDWPFVYHCAGDCDAYVGLHPNTDIPLGYLADRETREARKEAKAMFFEWLDLAGLRTQRNKAYPVLASAMGLPIDQCHFAMFDVAKCVEAQAYLGQFMAEYLNAKPGANTDGLLPWEEFSPPGAN